MTRTSFAVTILAISAALILIPLAGCGEEADQAETTKTVAAEPNTLVSVKVADGPALDAKNGDSSWDEAPKLKVQAVNGDNFVGGETDITMQSLHTDDEIYFKIQWSDPTESLERTPWVKQDDGSWKKTPASEKYEDKLAIIWNIDDSIMDFNTQGCLVACHAGEAVPEGGDYGKKYTASPGEVGDIWHWKAARTDSLDVSPSVGSYVDDQGLDSTPYDPSVRKGHAGRHSDDGDGAYTNNDNDDKTMPKFQWMNIPDDSREMNYLTDDNMVALVDSEWSSGDALPGVFIGNPSGDRADITAASHYSNGEWTLIIKRNLVTGSTADPAVDVQFDDLGKNYFFGISAFDNAQLKHAYVSDVITLKFEE